MLNTLKDWIAAHCNSSRNKYFEVGNQQRKNIWKSAFSWYWGSLSSAVQALPQPQNVKMGLKWCHWNKTIKTATYTYIPSPQENSSCSSHREHSVDSLSGQAGWEMCPKYQDCVSDLQVHPNMHGGGFETSLPQILNNLNMVCWFKKKKKVIVTTCSWFVSLIFNGS